MEPGGSGVCPSLCLEHDHGLVNLQLALTVIFKVQRFFILYLKVQSEIKQWDLMADGYNLITWDPEASGIQVQGQPGSGSESLGQ